MTNKEKLLRDWTYSEIEKRSLQFLLSDKHKKEYLRWLKEPEAYKTIVRNIPYEQTLDDLVKYAEKFRGSLHRTETEL